MNHTSEYIDLLQRLIRIPSVSGEEKAAADLVQRFLEDKGCTVHRRINNLWIESESEAAGKPTLLLNAHLDTVKASAGYSFDPYCGRLENGRILGLGSNDDGGSLVSLIQAWFLLTAHEQPYRLVFSATAQEENSGADGFDAVKGEWGNVRLGIIGEPTGMKMAVAEKGLLVLDCTARGITGHAAREGGVNAIYKAMQDIEWFRSYRFPRESQYLGPVKMSVTTIEAGYLHNVIPDSCRFTVDIRSNGEYSNAQILETVLQNVQCEVKPRSLRNNSSSISTGSAVVRRGLEMGLEAFGSPTTSNSTRCDFPTLKIGPGLSERSHTADEFILLSELEEAAGIYFKLLDKLEI